MDRRAFLAGSAAATLVTPSFAQDYPSRPVTLVNPFPPGGAVDVVGRPFAAALEPLLKQPVVVETKAGAAGAVGAQFAANAKPDGYTLLAHLPSISGFAAVDGLFGRTPKFTRDRLHPDRAADRRPDGARRQRSAALQDAEGVRRRRQGESQQADLLSSSGLYGALHLPMALLIKAAGIQLKHLPTAGGGPALTALLGNNAQALVSFDRGGQCADQGRQVARARLLLVEARRVAARCADLKELGYDVEFSIWGGLFAPEGHAGRGDHQGARRRPRRSVDSDQFKTAIANIGDVVAYLDQPEFRAFWDADAKRVEAAVQSIGKVEG